MNSDSFSYNVVDRIRLKEPKGWFAAGDGFRNASKLLSDGAFKLFIFLSLESNHRTGRYTTTHKELAHTLGKSKRAIGTYIAELKAKGICDVCPGKNQFALTSFEICDRYWPYHRNSDHSDAKTQNAFVASVRAAFLNLGCVSGRFGVPDLEHAQDLHRRGVSLASIEDAMVLGACRKYISWLNGEAPKPIQSLAYFDRLIAEIKEQALSVDYGKYLRLKLGHLAQAWTEQSVKGPKGGVSKYAIP
jgi:hypothetical protein